MKISHYILLSFAFVLILFSIATFINFQLSEAVTENAEYFSRSTTVMKISNRFQRNVLTMANGLRGYSLTGEKSFLESYNGANIENDSIITELNTLLVDTSQSYLLQETQDINNKWRQEYAEPLAFAQTLSNGRKSLDTFNRYYRERMLAADEKNLDTSLQQKFKEFVAFEYDMRIQRKETLASSVRITRKLSFLLTLVSGITAVLVVMFLVYTITKRIRQMTAMANAIAGGNYDVNVTDVGKDELSSLGHSLNHMSTQLSKNIFLLKRSNEELDQFAHIVSHDMKGPLRGIGNVVTWIEEDHTEELTPKVKEYLELIKSRIVRAENLIEGLLAYARADKAEIPIETVDLNGVLEEVLGNLPVNDKVKVEVEPLPVLHAERLLLFEIFYNLVSNAIKYNDKDNGLVKVYAREEAKHWRFFVEDNGIGIAEIYHKRIFVVFQTLKERDTVESTGVGLAIVKKILDRKKQTIHVSSQPGIGSIFSFTWPKN